MRRQHEQKREIWRNFLQDVIPQALSNRFVIVEISDGKRKGLRPQQSIYGAVREACTLEKISSQMLQTVTPTKASGTNANPEEAPVYSNKTKGRVLNAV